MRLKGVQTPPTDFPATHEFFVFENPFSFLQHTGDGRVLAPVHQQRGQRGQVQESGGLVRRLTRRMVNIVSDRGGRLLVIPYTIHDFSKCFVCFPCRF